MASFDNIQLFCYFFGHKQQQLMHKQQQLMHKQQHLMQKYQQLMTHCWHYLVWGCTSSSSLCTSSSTLCTLCKNNTKLSRAKLKLGWAWQNDLFWYLWNWHLVWRLIECMLRFWTLKWTKYVRNKKIVSTNKKWITFCVCFSPCIRPNHYFLHSCLGDNGR